MRVEIEIPDGKTCTYESSGKPCMLAKYSRKWEAYNCALHHRLLRGGQRAPIKCRECIEAARGEKA